MGAAKQTGRLHSPAAAQPGRVAPKFISASAQKCVSVISRLRLCHDCVLLRTIFLVAQRVSPLLTPGQNACLLCCVACLRLDFSPALCVPASHEEPCHREGHGVSQMPAVAAMLHACILTKPLCVPATDGELAKEGGQGRPAALWPACLPSLQRGMPAS